MVKIEKRKFQEKKHWVCLLFSQTQVVTEVFASNFIDCVCVFLCNDISTFYNQSLAHVQIYCQVQSLSSSIQRTKKRTSWFVFRCEKERNTYLLIKNGCICWCWVLPFPCSMFSEFGCRRWREEKKITPLNW